MMIIGEFIDAWGNLTYINLAGFVAARELPTNEFIGVYEDEDPDEMSEDDKAIFQRPLSEITIATPGQVITYPIRAECKELLGKIKEQFDNLAQKSTILQPVPIHRR